MTERSSRANSAQELSSRAIVVFVSLQALDVITTLIGIRVGAQEANITVARLMHLGPVTGLLSAKLLGLVCRQNDVTP